MSTFTLYRLSTEYALQRVAAVAQRLRRDEEGQDIVEYAGMLAIIALVVAFILTLHLPQTIGNALDSAVKSITGSGGSSGSTPGH